MKFKIILDPLTNVVNGYEVVTKNTQIFRDDIIMDYDEFPTQTEDPSKIIGNIYCEGKFLAYQEKVSGSKDQLARAHRIANNEQKALVDLLAGGLSMQEAAKQIQDNRVKLEDLLKEEAENKRIRQEEIRSFYKEKYLQEAKQKDYKYYSSVCLLAKDEDDYLQEWLEYYINDLKTDHIYIYDNESENPVRNFVGTLDEPLRDKITIVEFANTADTQNDAYNHFLKNYGDEVRWAGFLDSDEQLQINDGSNDINEMLRKHEEHGVVGFNWVTYDANGQEKKTEGLVRERFTRKSEYDPDPHLRKFFLQAEFVHGFMHGWKPILNHYLEYFDDEDFTICEIRHYYTKSLEEWTEKIKRGTVNPLCCRKYKEFFTVNPDMVHLENLEDFRQNYNGN